MSIESIYCHLYLIVTVIMAAAFMFVHFVVTSGKVRVYQEIFSSFCKLSDIITLQDIQLTYHNPSMIQSCERLKGMQFCQGILCSNVTRVSFPKFDRKRGIQQWLRCSISTHGFICVFPIPSDLK